MRVSGVADGAEVRLAVVLVRHGDPLRASEVPQTLVHQAAALAILRPPSERTCHLPRHSSCTNFCEPLHLQGETSLDRASSASKQMRHCLSSCLCAFANIAASGRVSQLHLLLLRRKKNKGRSDLNC